MVPSSEKRSASGQSRRVDESQRGTLNLDSGCRRRRGRGTLLRAAGGHATRGRSGRPPRIGGSPNSTPLNSIYYKADPPDLGGSEISAAGRQGTNGWCWSSRRGSALQGFPAGFLWPDQAPWCLEHLIPRSSNKMVVFDCAVAARLAGIAVCGYQPGVSGFH